MDLTQFRKGMKGTWGKYKYIVLVIVLGMVLMWIPDAEEKPAVSQPEPAAETMEMAEELEEILAQIQGVGKVKVMLSKARGEEVLYQSDTDESASDGAGSNRKDTVIITDENRAQTGLVRQIIPPAYLGAIVVCQGGDNAGVRLAVVKAVSDVTGLGADSISVLKMK